MLSEEHDYSSKPEEINTIGHKMQAGCTECILRNKIMYSAAVAFFGPPLIPSLG